MAFDFGGLGNDFKGLINGLGEGFSSIGNLFGKGGAKGGGGLEFPVGLGSQGNNLNGLIGGGGIQAPNQVGGVGGAGGGFNFGGLLGSALSTDKQQGWLDGGLGALGDLGSMYGNYQKIKLGKEQLGNQRSIYNNNQQNKVQTANQTALGKYMNTPGNDVSPEGIARFKAANTLGFDRL